MCLSKAENFNNGHSRVFFFSLMILAANNVTAEPKSPIIHGENSGIEGVGLTVVEGLMVEAGKSDEVGEGEHRDSEGDTVK